MFVIWTSEFSDRWERRGKCVNVKSMLEGFPAFLVPSSASGICALCVCWGLLLIRGLGIMLRKTWSSVRLCMCAITVSPLRLKRPEQNEWGWQWVFFFAWAPIWPETMCACSLSCSDLQHLHPSLFFFFLPVSYFSDFCSRVSADLNPFSRMDSKLKSFSWI